MEHRPGLVAVAESPAAHPAAGLPAGPRRVQTRRASHRIDALLVVLGMGLLGFVWRMQDLYAFLRPLHLPMVTPPLLILLFMLDKSPLRKLRALRLPMAKIAFAILVLMILSIPDALYPGRAFRFVLNDHLPNLILMASIAVAVRDLTDVERLMRVQVIGCLLFSVIVLTRYHVTANGRLGDLAYYDANDMAMMVVCTLPLMVYLFQRTSRVLSKIFYVGSAIIFVVAIVKSGSRGGFLGLIGVTLALLFLLRAVPVKVRVRVILVLGGMFVLTANDTYWGFIRTLANPTQDYNWAGESEGGRMEVWKRGIGYMLHNPFFGVGARNFNVAESRFSPRAVRARERGREGEGVIWTAAHNSFVEIGAELGAFGLILFVSLLWISIRTLVKVATGPPNPDPEATRTAGLAQVFAATLIGYAICGFFLSQAYAAYLYSSIGLIMGVLKLSPSLQSPARRRRRLRAAH